MTIENISFKECKEKCIANYYASLENMDYEKEFPNVVTPDTKSNICDKRNGVNNILAPGKYNKIASEIPLK